MLKRLIFTIFIHDQFMNLISYFNMFCVVKPCIFCAYASQQAVRALVYEDELVVAFQSKSPAATQHLLVVPRAHIATVKDLKFGHIGLLKHMELIGKKVLERPESEGKLSSRYLYGFHVPPFNSVDHLHLHCFALPFLDGWRQIKYLPKSPWFLTMTDLIKKLERNSQML
jgi:sulfate adenylyltransferase (ADP) / adenylylsulfatase